MHKVLPDSWRFRIFDCAYSDTFPKASHPFASLDRKPFPLLRFRSGISSWQFRHNFPLLMSPICIYIYSERTYIAEANCHMCSTLKAKFFSTFGRRSGGRCRKILSESSRSIVRVFGIPIFPGDCAYLMKHANGILRRDTFYASL